MSDKDSSVGGGMGSFLLIRRPRGGERVADNRGQITHFNVRRVVKPVDELFGPAPRFGPRSVGAGYMMVQPPTGEVYVEQFVNPPSEVDPSTPGPNHRRIVAARDRGVNPPPARVTAGSDLGLQPASEKAIQRSAEPGQWLEGGTAVERPLD